MVRSTLRADPAIVRDPFFGASLRKVKNALASLLRRDFKNPGS